MRRERETERLKSERDIGRERDKRDSERQRGGGEEGETD